MPIICGVDVSKAQLDAAIEPGGAFSSFANDAEGIAELCAWRRKLGAELVAMEASGGYERQAFLLLWQQDLACAVVNATRVRQFAEAMDYLEKTDKIDARVIALYGQAKNLKPSPCPSPEQQRLSALVRRLAQITADLTVQKQRLSQARDADSHDSLAEAIGFFRSQAKKLETAIAGLIDGDRLWAKLDESFRTIKGVASRTVATIMADLPEIGLLSNKAIAKLVGLAPLAKDSGKRQGKRHIRGGRAPVRSILYLVADIARRYDQDLADFRNRLIAAGKPKMVVRIALAHKLLVRLNAKAREVRAELAKPDQADKPNTKLAKPAHAA